MYFATQLPSVFVLAQTINHYRYDVILRYTLSSRQHRSHVVQLCGIMMLEVEKASFG